MSHTNPNFVAYIDQVEARDTVMWYGQVTEPEKIMMCHMVRYEVFIKGQGVAWAFDVDGQDHNYLHFLGTADDDPVAAARIQRGGTQCSCNG